MSCVYFSNNLINFISRNSLIICKKNTFFIYKIRKRTKNRYTFVKILEMSIEIDIIFVFSSSKLSFFIVYDLNKNIRVYDSKTYKLIRMFFLNLNIIFIKNFSFSQDIFYILHTGTSLHHFFLNSFTKIQLAILNLTECKYINLLTLKNTWFYQNSINFINKQRLIILDSNQIVFLFFNLKYRKLYKKIINTSSEICFLNIFSNSLLYVNRKKKLFLLRINKCICSGKIHIKKIKKWNFKNLICNLVLLYHNLIIGFYNFKKVIYLSKKYKKRLFAIFKTNCSVLKINRLNHTDFLIITNRNFIICNKIQTYNINGAYFLISFFEKKKWFDCKKKIQIEIFPLLFFSNSLYLITDKKCYFYLVNINKTLFNLNFFVNNFYKKNLKNESNIAIVCDLIGKCVFLLIGFSVIKICIQNNIKSGNFNTIELFGQKSETLHFNNKNVNFFTDKKGKYIGIKLNNFCVKIWNINIFLSNKNIAFKKKVCSSKKISFCSISNDGFFLVVNFSKFVVLWKLHPELMKLKTFLLHVQDPIFFLKFFPSFEKRLIIYTSSEFGIFDLEKNSFIWKFKIKVLTLSIDNWNTVLAIKTKYLTFKSNEILEAIVLFKLCPVPIVVVNLHPNIHTSLLLLFFSYLNNSQSKKSIIYIDSLLTFHKFFF
nr:hypothetical protein CparaKRNrm1_p090 [Cryptomonas paramecium]